MKRTSVTAEDNPMTPEQIQEYYNTLEFPNFFLISSYFPNTGSKDEHLQEKIK